MASKSCPRTSAIEFSQFSAAQLGHHSDPIMYTVGDCMSDGRKKSSKRLFEESLERGSKRSRTDQSFSENSGLTFNSISSDSSSRSQSVISISSDSSPRSQSVISISSDSSPRSQSVISISSDSSPRSQSVIIISSDSSDSGLPVSKGEIQKLSRKRKSTSDGDERPSKRSRRTPSPSESSDHQAEASTSDDIAPYHSRAAFEDKYDEGKLLGKGTFGSVFAGHRRADNLPVAIKHIRDDSSIEFTPMELEGKRCLIPLEVALLLMLQPKEGETSAVVALLEWYDLDDELILVLERPVPCVDMTGYIYSNQRLDSLPEDEAKILTRQLVDALIEIHSKGVFHNDIKIDNILVETDVPRVRIIDFGYGEFVKEGLYRTNQGTTVYTSPEWFRHGCYEAEPATVWQLGVTVFEMLHRRLPFKHRDDIVHKHPDISQNLSFDCQDFLMCCLVKRPQGRYTLEELRRHDWLE